LCSAPAREKREERREKREERREKEVRCCRAERRALM